MIALFVLAGFLGAYVVAFAVYQLVAHRRRALVDPLNPRSLTTLGFTVEVVDVVADLERALDAAATALGLVVGGDRLQRREGQVSGWTGTALLSNPRDTCYQVVAVADPTANPPCLVVGARRRLRWGTNGRRARLVETALCHRAATALRLVLATP